MLRTTPGATLRARAQDLLPRAVQMTSRFVTACQTSRTSPYCCRHQTCGGSTAATPAHISVAQAANCSGFSCRQPKPTGGRQRFPATLSEAPAVNWSVSCCRRVKPAGTLQRISAVLSAAVKAAAISVLRAALWLAQPLLVLVLRAVVRNRAFWERGLSSAWHRKGGVTPDIIDAYRRPQLVSTAIGAHLKAPLEHRIWPLSAHVKHAHSSLLQPRTQMAIELLKPLSHP